VGLLVAGLCIGAQAWAIGRGVDYWQTMVFTVLTLSQLFQSLAVRSERASLLTIGLTSNLTMLSALAVTLLLQLSVIYLPVFNEILKTQPLPLSDLLICVALSSLVFFAVEFEKALVRRGWLYAD
jgi:Ca2+-transporting ATPase